MKKMNDDFVVDKNYYNNLDIEGFSKMMKDPSFCYKFYWLESIVIIISEGKTYATFDEIINKMITNAWYSVLEYKIHLSTLICGEIKDGLERAINKLQSLSGLNSGSTQIEIENAIKQFDKEIKDEKKQLTNMVPYRALSGFFEKSQEVVPWDKLQKLIQFANKFDQEVELLPYTYSNDSGLNRVIFFNQDWIKMIKDNVVPILGWIQFEKVKWLQMINPEVPGLVYKLRASDEKERKLEAVRKLWKGILSIHPVKDIFTGKEVEILNFDVDHFIPRSFVMNDELWDLLPMDSNLNSSKGKKLPSWDRYFEEYANNQFMMYEDIHNYEKIKICFLECYKDNLHSTWASQELYIKGNDKTSFKGILEKNMRPIYDSAHRQGYSLWTS